MKQKIRKKRREGRGEEGHKEIPPHPHPAPNSQDNSSARLGSQGLRPFIHTGHGHVRFRRWVCSVQIRNSYPTLQYLVSATAFITLG